MYRHVACSVSSVNKDMHHMQGCVFKLHFAYLQFVMLVVSHLIGENYLVVLTGCDSICLDGGQVVRIWAEGLMGLMQKLHLLQNFDFKLYSINIS
jgi:hypothetical protein